MGKSKQQPKIIRVRVALPADKRAELAQEARAEGVRLEVHLGRLISAGGGWWLRLGAQEQAVLARLAQAQGVPLEEYLLQMASNTARVLGAAWRDANVAA